MVDNLMLEAALQYAARGWPVFAIGRSKIPFKGTHGFKDATLDPTALEAMWRLHPGANVAMATGRIIVFDCDGDKGKQDFAALGPLTQTLAAHTPRGGLHLYYESPADLHARNHAAARESGAAGLDIRGHGGGVLLPPSINRERQTYRWLNNEPIAPLPPHLRTYIERLGITGNEEKPALKLPPHLAGRPRKNLADAALAGFAVEWSAHEEARIRGALKFLGTSIGYDGYFRVVCALHNLNWNFNGEDRGFTLLDEWAAALPYYNLDGLEKKWESVCKSKRIDGLVTIGTLFSMATAAGWAGQVETPADRIATFPFSGAGSAGEGADYHANVIGQEVGNSPSEPLNGHANMALFAPIPQEIVFPDTDKAGNPRATCENARRAIEALGIKCAKNIFHDRMEIAGHPTQRWQNQVSDEAVLAVRWMVHQRYRFDPGTANTNDAIIQLCLLHHYHPIQDYLDKLAWDGAPRLGNWLHTYLSADASPLNCEFGRLILTAAVRRIRSPGAKFDEILVLEGPEGANKSAAIRVLAGNDNFSDQPILTLDDRSQQEAMRGVWLYEIADLTGISRADIDRVKAFASRTVDRARPAYGRYRVDAPRQCVLFGTTNNEQYLQSQTGNRRWWPVKCGRVRLDELARDRNQLWAEAVTLDKRNEEIRLKAEFWGAAGELQEARRERDPWEDSLRHVGATDKNVFNTAYGQEIRVSSTDLLCINLQIEPGRLQQAHGKRLLYVMRKLGWDGPKLVWFGDKPLRGYTKTVMGDRSVS